MVMNLDCSPVGKIGNSLRRYRRTFAAQCVLEEEQIDSIMGLDPHGIMQRYLSRPDCKDSASLFYNRMSLEQGSVAIKLATNNGNIGASYCCQSALPIF